MKKIAADSLKLKQGIRVAMPGATIQQVFKVLNFIRENEIETKTTQEVAAAIELYQDVTSGNLDYNPVYYDG